MRAQAHACIHTHDFYGLFRLIPVLCVLSICLCVFFMYGLRASGVWGGMNADPMQLNACCDLRRPMPWRFAESTGCVGDWGVGLRDFVRFGA